MKQSEKRIVSPEAVKQLADIAGLDVDLDRAEELAPQIQSLRDSINAMDEVDLTDVEPATIFPLTCAPSSNPFGMPKRSPHDHDTASLRPSTR